MLEQMDRMRQNFLPEFVSMRRKIAAVAVTYDPKTMGNLLRAAFGGDALTPTQLTEALRRTLQVTLTPAELGAPLEPNTTPPGLISCHGALVSTFTCATGAWVHSSSKLASTSEMLSGAIRGPLKKRVPQREQNSRVPPPGV